MTLTIHIEQLRDACSDQFDLFKVTFGENVSFKTEAEMVAAARKYARDFDFEWAGKNLLNQHSSIAYDETIVPIWLEYRNARKQLFNAYNARRAEAFARAYWAQETA